MSGIRYSWCKELDQVLTAQEAKREFFVTNPRALKFSFFCPNPDCLQEDGTRTRVSCINYRSHPQEQDQSVVVHYRQWDTHVHSCDSFEAPAALARGGTPSWSRNVGLKSAGAFDIFDPADELETQLASGASVVALGRNSPLRPGTSFGGIKDRDPGVETVSSTRFVEDLAMLHVQAKSDPNASMLLERYIRVPGRGTRHLKDLFQHISSARVDGTPRIWFGGARMQRIDIGFYLRFIDKVEGLHVETHISTNEVEAYRHRRHLTDLLSAADDCRYVTAYIWGTVEGSNQDGSCGVLQPARLQHLALILGPRKSATVRQL